MGIHMPNARLMGSHTNEALFHFPCQRIKAPAPSVVKLKLHPSLAAKVYSCGILQRLFHWFIKQSFWLYPFHAMVKGLVLFSSH